MNEKNKNRLQMLAIIIPFTIYFGYRAVESIEVDRCVEREKDRLEYYKSEFKSADESDKEKLHEHLTNQIKIVELFERSLITEKKEICEVIRDHNEKDRKEKGNENKG